MQWEYIEIAALTTNRNTGIEWKMICLYIQNAILNTL